MNFEIGQRVQISVEYSWAKGASGTISGYPEMVLDSMEDELPLGDCWRLVNTLLGQEKYYWVELDQPQNDDDGDGPYREAEFPEKFLIESD